jgi:hypothetical protein
MVFLAGFAMADDATYRSGQTSPQCPGPTHVVEHSSATTLDGADTVTTTVDIDYWEESSHRRNGVKNLSRETVSPQDATITVPLLGIGNGVGSYSGIYGDLWNYAGSTAEELSKNQSNRIALLANGGVASETRTWMRKQLYIFKMDNNLAVCPTGAYEKRSDCITEDSQWIIKNQSGDVFATQVATSRVCNDIGCTTVTLTQSNGDYSTTVSVDNVPALFWTGSNFVLNTTCTAGICTISLNNEPLNSVSDVLLAGFIAGYSGCADPVFNDPATPGQ